MHEWIWTYEGYNPARERLRDVCGKLAQHCLVALAKCVLLIGQQVHRAKDLTLVPQRHGQTLLLRDRSPRNGAAMRELSCSKKRYMAISPWSLPRLDHSSGMIVPTLVATVRRRSRRKTCLYGMSERSRLLILGPLRSPTGASPLATGLC